MQNEHGQEYPQGPDGFRRELKAVRTFDGMVVVAVARDSVERATAMPSEKCQDIDQPKITAGPGGIFLPTESLLSWLWYALITTLHPGEEGFAVLLLGKGSLGSYDL